MKLRYLTFALAVAISSFAGAEEKSGFYLDGSAGRASNSLGESDSVVSLFDAGYRWSWISLDLGYVAMSRANTPVREITDGTFSPIFFRYGSKENGVTFDVGGRWHVGDNWYFDSRAGLYSWRNVFYQTNLEPIASHSKSRRSAVSWNAGVGFGYDFTEHVSLGLRYDAYHGGEQTTKPISLTAEVRF